MEKIDYKHLASKLFCWLFFALLTLLFFKYLFGYTVPFLVAWGIAYLIYPLANELSSKIKLSRRACSFVLVLILLTVILSLVFLIGNRLLLEIQNLVNYLTENEEEIARYFESIFNFISSIGEKLPIINKLQDTGLVANIVENFNTFLTSIWQSLLEKLGSTIPMLAGSIVTTLPNILFVSIITVIACFYFALDLDVLHNKLNEVLPRKVIVYTKELKERIISGFKKYLRAYFFIFIITFAELFVGFLILGIDYSFVLALLIAFVDFLPVFGTGAILVPWAIILLLMKEYFLGIGLFILFGLITVVRQVVEPRIVGKSLGVHPLLTLVTLYIGFRLFGILGMIFLPIAVLILFSKNEREAENKEK